MKISFFVKLSGEYKTEVREVDPNEQPIVGQSKSLNCYNSEENKGNPEAEQHAVRWIHEGLVVRNDDRHEGASNRVSCVRKFICNRGELLSVKSQIEQGNTHLY